MASNNISLANTENGLDVSVQFLLSDLRQIIENARQNVASTANYELTMMYWHIGERINRDVLGNQRAEYGKSIVTQVARQLQVVYGAKGFDVKSIRRMMQFASLLNNEKIRLLLYWWNDFQNLKK